jgi:hypothetical protein
MIAEPNGVDIRLTNDITISSGVAARIVDLIELARVLLLRQNGCPLPPLDDQIQQSLRECLNLRATSAVASTPVTLSHSVLASASERLTVQAAALELKMSESGVKWACEHKQLGTKEGRQWWIDREDLEMYKITRTKGAA